MKRSVTRMLKEGVVLGDGGYVYILKQRGLPMKDYAPQDILTHEDEVRKLTQEFHDAGAEVIQAQTFGGTRNRLAAVGAKDQFAKINRKAVQVAREVTQGRVPSGGSVSSLFGTGSRLGEYGRKQAMDDYHEQCALLVELGVDFLILETFFFLDDALLALKATESLQIERMITVSMEENEVTRDGYTPADCARALADGGADIVGLNCMIEPERMLEFARQMRKAVDTPIATQPVGIRCWPEFTHLHDVHDDWPRRVLPPERMADYALKAREMGVNYIGACCGAGPEHIAAMARALGKKSHEHTPRIQI